MNHNFRDIIEDCDHEEEHVDVRARLHSFNFEDEKEESKDTLESEPRHRDPEEEHF